MAVEILGVVAGFLGPALELGKCFAEPIKRQFNYLCCFNTNIQNLRGEAQKLEDTRSGLQMKVDAEENNAQIIVPEVKTWFNKADGIQAKYTEIESEITTFRQNGCFTVKSRYSLGKKVKKTAEDMKDLREEGSKFTIIATPPPPAAVAAPIPLGSNIFEFDSRKQTEEEIIVSLKDGNVNKLGICGMGGVGKTTMAKRIMHRVSEEHLFDEIVMAVVSQKPDRLGIQGVIAKMLGLELKDEERIECRAVDLNVRLTAGTKRSLIVLDDVWEVLNLEELGIPCHSGCKILLTSRYTDTLKRMDVEKVSAVRDLSETEAWDLFKSKAGSCIEQENVINVAQQVVNECKGLPIALVTVGVTLKDTVNIRHWNHALDQLKSANPNHMPEVIGDVYKPLRLSYKSLESEDEKSLFLLCCLFPEDYDIPLEDLAMYAMGLRMFGDIRSLEEARETVSFLVERLKSCFLLLEGESENHVKMHDVVRDVAIFIAADERRINCDDCTWIASYTEERFELHMGSAVYPNLHLLLIDDWSRDEELEIGDDFFEGMEQLNVLSIEYSSSLRRLPKMTKLMKNLKTLILYWCESLESISIVGELVNLEILICRWCELIECLPIEMAGISRLRLLELRRCRNLKTIAPGIISNQKGLEELIVEDFDNWEAADEERERKNASLSELEHLSRLNRLKIKIKDYKVAAGHKLPPNMVKYDIIIGDDNVMFLNVTGEFKKNALKLTMLPGNNSLGKWIHECVRIVEYMRLERSDDSSLDFGDAHNMRSLILEECSAVKKLVDMRSSSATVFPLLEHLKLEELSELEMICDIDGPMQSNSFLNLKELRLIQLPPLKHLWNSVISPNQQNIISSFNKLSTIYICECHGLRSLFSLSAMARGSWFEQLESLEIRRCNMMEQVLLLNEEKIQINIHIPLVFPKLKKLELVSLSRLTSFSKGIFQSIEFPLLEKMEVWYCPLQSFVFTACSTRSPDDVDSRHLFGELNKVKFGSLKVLKLSGIKSSKSLFSLSMTERNCLLQLEELEIEECDVIEQVLQWNGEENQKNNGITLQFPELKLLKLSHMPMLTSFSKGFQSIEFPLLEKMEVHYCPLLKGLVSSASSKDHDDISNIQFFSKVKFDRLTKLVVAKTGINWHQFPIDLFARLCELEVSGVKEMKSLFSLPMTQSGCLLQLETLEISDCEIMEQIILWNEEESQRNIHITPFPKLKLLILDSLPRLTSFCKRIKGIVEFSLPNKLEIRNCSVLLESCVSMSISSTGPPHDADDTVHLFCKPNKVEFGYLKELRISNYYGVRNWCGQIPIDFFAVLCKLEVSWLIGMKSLFPCSIARNLRNLEQLLIVGCVEMVKVIEDEDYDALQISLFPNLNRLYLRDLKELKCFCEWRCTLQLPKLQHVTIIDCDVMDEFTLGALNTPNLEKIFIDEKDSGNEVKKALQQRRLKREKQLKTRLEESSSAEADSTN